MNDRMKFLPAECIEDGQFVMGQNGLMTVLKVEWPYAVVREFTNGEFGQRAFVQLEGRYHIPSTEFLTELGLYKNQNEALYVVMSETEANVLPGARERKPKR